MKTNQTKNSFFFKKYMYAEGIDQSDDWSLETSLWYSSLIHRFSRCMLLNDFIWYIHKTLYLFILLFHVGIYYFYTCRIWSLIKKLIHEYDMTSSLSYKKLESENNLDGQLELRSSVSWTIIYKKNNYKLIVAISLQFKILKNAVYLHVLPWKTFQNNVINTIIFTIIKTITITTL